MKLTAQSVERAAVHYLQRFPASSAHLRRVLRRKAARVEAPKAGVDVDALIDRAVEAAQRMGLVDDAAFARGLAASLHRRGSSRRLIEQKMRHKLVPPEEIAAALDELFAAAEDPESDAAWAYARRRRLGPFRDPEARAERRDKDLAALARRGFSYRVASRVVDADEETLEARRFD